MDVEQAVFREELRGALPSYARLTLLVAVIYDDIAFQRPNPLTVEGIPFAPPG